MSVCAGHGYYLGNNSCPSCSQSGMRGTYSQFTDEEYRTACEIAMLGRPKPFVKSESPKPNGVKTGNTDIGVYNFNWHYDPEAKPISADNIEIVGPSGKFRMPYSIFEIMSRQLMELYGDKRFS